MVTEVDVYQIRVVTLMASVQKVIAATVLFGAPAFSATAQEWPQSKPITLLMGFPPGSGVDIVARTVQAPLEAALGAKIIADYRPGAGG